MNPPKSQLDPSKYPVTEEDIALFARELRSFIPPNAFDAHAHLYDLEAIGQTGGQVGFSSYFESQSAWMGDRAPREGLFFPFPRKGIDTLEANRFLVRQLEGRPGCRGLALALPGDDPAEAEAFVRDHGLAGFKVYHVYADREDTLESECGEFLPEWVWEIAHRRSLCIMLHIVRARALADAENQAYLREHCLRFPGAKLVLAHAARGFCGRHTAEGIAALKGIDNVFFDTSAVCDPIAFDAIIDAFGPSRLFYGSDFPVSEFRGKAVPVGDGFFWLHDHNANWEGWTLGRPTRVGIESLLALKDACHRAKLSDHDVEALFCQNARQLLG